MIGLWYFSGWFSGKWKTSLAFQLSSAGVTGDLLGLPVLLGPALAVTRSRAAGRDPVQPKRGPHSHARPPEVNL